MTRLTELRTLALMPPDDRSSKRTSPRSDRTGSVLPQATVVPVSAVCTEGPGRRNFWSRAKDIAPTLQSYAIILGLIVGGFWTLASRQKQINEAQLAKLQIEVENARRQLSKRGILTTDLALTVVVRPEDGRRFIEIRPTLKNLGVDDISLDLETMTWTVEKIVDTKEGYPTYELISQRVGAGPDKTITTTTIRPEEPTTLSLLVPLRGPGLYECSVKFARAGQLFRIGHAIAVE